MARFFNTDFISFSMTSGAPYPGITRKFWSFSEAARENGASRVLCGIHFSTAVNAGYIQGERGLSNKHCGLQSLSRRSPLPPRRQKRNTEAAEH